MEINSPSWMQLEGFDQQLERLGMMVGKIAAYTLRPPKTMIQFTEQPTERMWEFAFAVRAGLCLRQKLAILFQQIGATEDAQFEVIADRIYDIRPATFNEVQIITRGINGRPPIPSAMCPNCGSKWSIQVLITPGG